MNDPEDADLERKPNAILEILEESGGDKLSWWLREFKEGYQDGKTPKEAAEDLYFKIEEAPTDITLLLGTSVMFGVAWEKEDTTPTIEEANDRLADGIEKANMTAKRGDMRPSTAMAFDALQDAHEILCTIDPTREDPTDES